MADPGRGENLRVLEEFVCEAEPEGSSVLPGRAGRGINPGIHIVAETTEGPTGPLVAPDRDKELRKCSTPDLLALVRRSAAGLSAEELLLIHNIAAERLGNHAPFFEAAIELSEEVMMVAVHRVS